VITAPQLEEYLEGCEVVYGPDFADGGRFFCVSRWVGLSGSPTRGFYDVDEFASEQIARERFDALIAGGEPT
jgi:hypothetical protein